ncbi:type II toxin-antitoxin system RelE/ParE family toxin [Arsenophonus sp. aPb]|uniref:Type II toxin-antitoxin system RelE/ParE family toxin n=1 Tax=Arsenophonus nasoniae TaxID=638 RepID=A0AA95GF82_9GAMM|nr:MULTISPECIES: type II toxin-antitoxin system RelE/ParE family toxin [Arsenophonus]WGL95859.1 type II toxin-antitoxin system RelE/ParE family toxin [Arsenophonus nasoniae]WGL97261.1 type II toxin-antitoxin system RelE/ParE family toxin [Arsenophonus sp. aPb]
MKYTIEYYSEEVEKDILSLPDTIQARYIRYTEKMRIYGANLGEPHTSSFGDGLFELRLKGCEGIGRVFYCTLIGKRIVMLHSFIKKTNKTPIKERQKAEKRLKEVKYGK